ncbi:MAG: hypothetical protein AAFP13_12210 [Pseudomonadota bacterium]
MFDAPGFLLAEIWLFLLFAALVGLAAGWLMFGGGTAPARARPDEVTALNADLGRCRAMNSDKDERIRALGAEIDALRAAAVPETPAEARQK